MKIRGLAIAFVFVAGCAVGGVSSRFVVPPANAQQAATLTKWEYMFIEAEHDDDRVLAEVNAAGAQAWELAGSLNPTRAKAVWCFKRPKM
jgi:uncharacterized lipoprotein YajG